MKLAPGTPLSVTLAIGEQPLPAARLAMAEGKAQLQWSPQVLERGLQLAPIHYPPEPGLHAAKSSGFEGLHGFLADSLPEGWGRAVMRKRLAKLNVDFDSLTALERLALVGAHGRGALCYEPATVTEEVIESLDLDVLANESRALLQGEESKLVETLAGLGGGSGGARPKVHVGFDGKGKISVADGDVATGHTAWLVKFKALTDPDDIGPLEEAYANMAEAAGLEISPHRLLLSKQGPGYFATRRFDRPETGGRLHMASLSGLMESHWEMPSSYDMLLRVTRAVTRNAGAVSQAFRRMVFNVLASNRDDHTRQHAYLMDQQGDWRLTPAFDLTYSPGPSGEHYLDIEGEGRRPTRAHTVSLGRKHSQDVKQITKVIEEVHDAVARWPDFANAAGVSKDSRKAAADAHSRIWKDFAPS